MAIVFGKRVGGVGGGAATSQEKSIIVPESAYRQGGDALVQAVLDFVNFAIRQAYFERDEISANAMRSYHVDFYGAQVANGGHGQYLGNSRMAAAILTDCQQGLEAMGHPAAALHGSILNLAKTEPRRIAAIAAAMGFGKADPFIENVNSQFFALNRTRPLRQANAEWLQRLPEIKVVADSALPAALKALADGNPAAAKRKAEREQAAKAAEANDPLLAALDYLASNAPTPVKRPRVISGRPGANLGDGIKVVHFVLDFEGKRGSAYFHPVDSLMFLDNDKTTPISRAPTTKVLDYVRDKTGRDLLAYIKPIT